MKKGEILRLTIDRLLPDGDGYAEYDEKSVTVRGALPGDVVDVMLTGVKRQSLRVKLVEVVTPGVERIPASCPHHAVCGGCRWQTVPYGVQCGLKESVVRATLASIPGMPPGDDITFTPSPDEYFYRNKMEFSFDSPPYEEGSTYLGLHEAGRFDRVFDVAECRLQSPLSNRAVALTREFVLKHDLTVYGLKSHVGLVRYLTVRDAKSTGEVMLVLTTSGDDFPAGEEYARFMTSALPGITTVVRTINHRTGSTAIGQERVILHGDGVIHERLGSQTFAISPESFFQTNSRQAVNLYDAIGDALALTGTERVLDLYCGTGTIGIYVAGKAASVTGIEIVEDAVADARGNALLNGVGNCTFHTGKVEKILDGGMGAFDAVICDPPRAGIHPRALMSLAELRIPRMAYVSCSIKQLPHDLEVLGMAGYRMTQVRAFDMSPHTPHIETMVGLEIR